MKFRKSFLILVLVSAMIATAHAAPSTLDSGASDVAEPLTGTFTLPVATATTTDAPSTDASSTDVSSTESTRVPDEASSGLADERLRASENAPVLSLTEVIALALQNNPQRQAAWEAVTAARARIGTAKAAGGPQVNLSGDASTQRNFGSSGSGSNFNNGSGGNFDTSSSGQDWNSNQSLSLNATIPVYTGGRVKASKRVAEYSAQAQEAQARTVEQELVYNTTVAYLNILRSQQLVEVGDVNLDVARERRRIAGVRFDAGAAARLEVLRAETDLANARQTRIASSNSLGQSLSSLNTLMGRAPETPLRVEPIVRLTLPGPLFITNQATPNITPAQTNTPATNTTPTTSTPAGEDTAPVGLPGSGATGVGGSTPTAGATNPTGGSTTSVPATTTGVGTITTVPSGQLQIAAGQGRQSLAVTQAQIRSAEASVDLARAARKPSIGLDILGLIRNPVSFAGRFLLSLGANVAQNLFDSGRTRSQIREAEAVVRQLRAQYQGQVQAVANQIEQSLLLLDSAQKRLETSDVGVVAAREALRAAQLGYSAGTQTALEVSDAQAALLAAETDAVNARFDVASAQAQLAAAVGIYPLEAQEVRRLMNRMQTSGGTAGRQ